MDKVFWDIIGAACPPPDGPNFEVAWHDNLVEQLATLPPEDIVRFDRWFDDRVDGLNTYDHWGAAYLLNGGASDDGFYYFRNWLVGMGKRVYEAALADPDSLAEAVNPTRDFYEAEIYSAARHAWQRQGRDEEAFYAACDALGPCERRLRGVGWDFGDEAEMRRRLPRLAARYFSAGLWGDDS
jgi:hypothetical protein